MEDGPSLVAETCERVFRDCAEPRAIALDPEGVAWRGALWSALEETGIATAWVPEEAGGAGATVREGFEVLHVAGRFAAAVPLADTLVAGMVLARAGLDVPPGKLAAAPMRVADPIELRPDGTLCGRAAQVPFAREAGHIAVLARGRGRGNGNGIDDGDGDGWRVALVERARCGLHEGRSVAGDPLDRLEFDRTVPVAVGARPVSLDEARLFGAASRAALIAGALQAILDLSVEYARERVAFERPIAKFQAVQQELARLAGEVAAANAAANSAAWALEHRGAQRDAVLVEVASAKVRAGEAAHAGALIAHQVHGAIGYSREHVLHRFTHRLWAWRDEFGDESEWALRLGRHFARLGGDGMWPALTAV